MNQDLLRVSLQIEPSTPPPVPNAQTTLKADLHASSHHTVSELFLETVHRYGTRMAFSSIQVQKTPADASSTRTFSKISYSWNEYSNAAKAFAKALMALGVHPRDVVTIQGSNSPQWLFANLGTMLAGGLSAGVYPSNGKELCEHVVQSSGATVAVVEDENQLQKYRGIRSSTLKCIVVWNKIKKQNPPFAVPVLSWDDFLQRGSTVPDSALEKRLAEQKPKDPCTLIYTSGTTGKPKAATLTHENLTWTASRAGAKFAIDSDHHGMSFLPLSHIAPLQLDFTIPLIFGSSTDIAPADALKGANLRKYLITTRPTYFLAVPRVWEKIKEGIDAKVKSASFLKRKLFEVSSRIGRSALPDYMYLSSKKETSPLSIWERIRYVFERALLSLLEKAVYSPIKQALGLDRCTIAASGAGAMDQKVRNFFDGLGLHVLDLYGMSESSGPVTLPDGQTPPGSCGKAIPQTQITILNPDKNGEGEILIKGPHIFSGYWRDASTTKDAIDKDGFLHTGDKGRLDTLGNLYITGRIKELIKTSGGENIPPIRIEDRIKTQLPIVSQAVVIGNNRNYLTCLLTLKTEVDKAGSPTDRLAPEVLSVLRGIASPATTLTDAAHDEKVTQFLMQGVQRANQLADSQAQHVHKISVLPEDFSVSKATMTPTLKLRRAAIEEKFQKEISDMYGQPATKT